MWRGHGRGWCVVHVASTELCRSAGCRDGECRPVLITCWPRPVVAASRRTMEPVAVTKDFNRNVLRFRVPREHPILDARRVQLRADGATGSDFGTRTARCPEPVPRWLELIGSMVTIPSGPAYATAMVAAANHVIAEALACGDDRHAVALRGLAQRAYEEAQARGGGTTALKAGFLKYAGATQRATAARREALLLNTESRHGRALPPSVCARAWVCSPRWLPQCVLTRPPPPARTRSLPDWRSCGDAVRSRASRLPPHGGRHVRG